MDVWKRIGAGGWQDMVIHREHRQVSAIPALLLSAVRRLHRLSWSCNRLSDAPILRLHTAQVQVEMTPPISPATVAFLVAQEDVSEGWYNANAAHPVWPGGESGVTIGIGYDLGNQTPTTILKDWSVAIGASNAAFFVRCAGVTGEAAHAILAQVGHVIVPWAAAISVFTTSTLPRYAAQTWDALPNCAALPPDAFGALVSIGYNRGNGGWTANQIDGVSRFHEMGEIRDAMDARDFGAIPAFIRSMRRLWPDGEPNAEHPQGSGLWLRRTKEAAMFEAALKPVGSSA